MRERYQITVQVTLDVADELALREAAFRARAADMAQSNLVGIAASMDPREMAGLDAQQALMALMTSSVNMPFWQSVFPGTEVLGSGGSVQRDVTGSG